MVCKRSNLKCTKYIILNLESQKAKLFGSIGTHLIIFLSRSSSMSFGQYISLLQSVTRQFTFAWLVAFYLPMCYNNRLYVIILDKEIFILTLLELNSRIVCYKSS